MAATTGLICVLCLSESPRTSFHVALTIVVPAAIYFLFQPHVNAVPLPISMIVTMGILVFISAGYHRDLVLHEAQRALLVERAREAAELAETNAALATLDALTGVPNRRAILEQIERELTLPNADRVHVALTDLDGFKQINDTYGFIVSGGEAARAFEFCKASLDAVSQGVGDGVVRDHLFAIGLGWDDRCSVTLVNRFADVVAVVAPVSQEHPSGW